MTAAPASQCLRLTRLDVLGGIPLGGDRIRLPADSDDRSSPREVLEAHARQVLATGPVFVSFSGGRDSSAVLAVLVHVARRDGFPLPTPLTLEVVGSQGADERDWQRLVLAHLGLADAERIPVTDQLDIVGPVARQIVARHGLLWPPNAHFHQPMLAEAAGGTLVTGIGGDEILGSSQLAPRLGGVLAREVPPRLSDAVRLVASVTPPLSVLLRYRRTPVLPWLTRQGRLRMRLRWARDESPDHRGWGESIRFWRRTRAPRYGERSLALIGSDHGTKLAHPLQTARFVEAMARTGGRAGVGTRTEVMQQLVGDLLPEPVLSRRSKAVMDDAMWSRDARALIAEVDAAAVCGSLADPMALRQAWLDRHAMASSALQWYLLDGAA